MKHRSPIAVALLSLVTLGIYSLYWLVKTKDEMNKRGANIPTAWLIIIPFVSIWWTWKYSEGVEQVTNNKMSTVIAFILLFLLGSIGEAIVQHTFNESAQTSEAGSTPVVNPTAPPESVPPPTAAEQPVASTASTPPENPTDPTSTPPPPSPPLVQ